MTCVRPNKSTLIHYHDAEKGKEKGSVEHQMMIFSIMSPACVSKLGWSCGRLSMDRTAPPEYYFQTVLRRVGMDVCRRAKQVPLSALFQRGWAYTPMFDIDVKETEAPFTNEILLEWGRLIVSTLLEFYPNCRWTPGIPFSGLLQAGEPGGRHAGRLQPLLFLRVRDSRQCASVLEVQADGPSIGEAVLQDRGPL